MNSYIYVEGLEFYANHGVFSEEKKLGQKFIFSVECKLNNYSSFLSDDLEQSVSYAEISQTIFEQVTTTKYNLLERLAYVIIKNIFEKYSLVEEVSLEINKPNAPMQQIFKRCGVRISMTRDDFYSIKKEV